MNARKPRRHFTLNILKCERLLIYYCMSKTHPAIGYNRWSKAKHVCKASVQMSAKRTNACIKASCSMVLFSVAPRCGTKHFQPYSSDG
jgi:hypothetical protein